MKRVPLFFFPFRLAISVLGLILVIDVNAQAGGNRLANLGSPSSSNPSGSGSTTVSSQTATAATTATSQTVQTFALAQRAAASLQQSLAVLQAQQAAQSAARNLAIGPMGPNNLGTVLQPLPNVPNGLVLGGLVPQGGIPNSTTVSGSIPGSAVSTYDLPASWDKTQIGALTQTITPVANQTTPETTVTITQTAQQALLNWQTFNIGKNTTLNFDQSAGGANVGQWIAINKVAASIAPSQILGAISAPGQVYVINQNGIIFGGSSQINVGALVASSLPINNNLVERGLLNNPDEQFLFSQLDLPAGTQGPTPAFTPQGTASAPGSAPAPGSYGANGNLVSQVDAAGNLSLVAASGHDGDVVVQAGAQISSPASSNNVGGKVALIGPNVANAGTISTPDGQTILAAGNQVGFAAHDSNDPTLRGLNVYIGAVDSSSGTASNAGLIESPRADITLAGKAVNQNGVIDSSTSVSLNGRIDLLADYNAVARVNGSGGYLGATGFFPVNAGTVTLGANSVSQILPEISSTATVTGTSLALPSLVNIQAQAIDMSGNALLWVPSASVATDDSGNITSQDAWSNILTAGVTLNAGQWLSNGSGAYEFENTSGQVYLDTGATIDVAGSQNVSASVAENIISAQLLGTELADSPLQQNGALRGATVQVDIRQTGNYNGTEWVGTPLADLSGYVNLIQRTVGELTTAGGTVAINAGNSVVVQPGSTIDVSGGWINYQGAIVQTTGVVSGGQIYNISKATPNLVYSGIYTGFTTGSSKWNVSQTFANPLRSGAQYEAGYIQGGSGGALSITAPAMALDGHLFGNTVAGAYQRTAAATVAATFAGTTYEPTLASILSVPNSSSLSLAFQTQNSALFNYPEYSPTPPNLIFQSDSSLPPAGAFGSALPQQRVTEVDLSPDLVSTDGFGSLTINNSDGNITVPANVNLTTPAGGSITLLGANIDIEGNLTAPGGSLTFNAYDYSPYADAASPLTGIALQATPAPDSTRGSFKLGSTGSLSTAGLIVDDRSTSATAASLPLVTNGGTIAINGYSVDLVAGSTVDVSGGVSISGANKVTYGNGGSLSIKAGQDPNLLSLLGGQLVLDASLEGYSGGKGGSLNIQAPLIQFGGVAADPVHTLLISPEFFTQGLAPGSLSEGGFASFTFTGLGEVVPNQSDPTLYLPAVSIAPGITLAPVAQSRLATFNNNDVTLTPTLPPQPSQRSPVSLTFAAPGVIDPHSGLVLIRGDFIMGAGAVIKTDPQTNSGGGVTIKANTVTIAAGTATAPTSIIIPGGTIAISGAKNSTTLFSDTSDPLVTVDIGSNSLLSTAGVVELTPNSLGYITGSVLPGGTISISGNILAEKDAVLDVRGASGVFDVSPTEAGIVLGNSLLSSAFVATRVDSSGGSITLTGSQELVADATFLGAAGGPSAQGGSLSISAPPLPINTSTTPLDPSLEVTQSALAYTASGVGNTVLVNGKLAVLGYFAADSFNASGLDSLTLGGTVEFSGSVTITANRSLIVGGGGVVLTDPSIPNSLVTLTAPYVALGQAFQGPLNLTQQQQPVFEDTNNSPVEIAPVYGTGGLTVNATSLIDVGNLSLQNIGNLNLVAANGDIRGDGTLDIAGTIALTAGQIYPTTETVFTIAAYDHGGTAGSVTIAASGSRQLPLSAGGTLNVYASDITQGGVLRAPIGTINLGGGVTSSISTDTLSGQPFDPTRNLTLTSGSITSVSAVDPVTGQNLTIPYGTILNGISWIDPAGNDITAAGNGPNAIPSKTINLSAVNVADQAGATIDLSGGGDLYAYRFVSGTGGTNDILASTTSFAVIPGYSAAYAPDGAYNVAPNAANPYNPNGAITDSGYVNGKLAVGEQVYLNASSGLAAGVYTLLPARYALLPGAFLITPKSGVPANVSTVQPDGSSIVSGYLYNGLDHVQTSPSLLASFEVDSQSVVRARAEYDSYSANTFLSKNALANNVAVPRLPIDAGQLVLAATQTMTIQGSVKSQALAGGLGSEVDIASPSDILISGSNTNLNGVSGATLVLDSSDLSAFGADSLLIGGYRTSTTGGTTVTVTTNKLVVDNAGATLTGPDVILVSNKSLTLDPNADVEQSGVLSSPAETLLLGSSGLAGSGDGVLLRVSSDSSAQIVRSGVDGASGPSLTIGTGTRIAGASLILDSSSATSLDPSAKLSGDTVSINSGQINLVLDGSQPTSGLVLSSTALANLQASAQALSLLSYSSIDIYENGTGSIGSAPDGSGKYQVQSLALHADEIQGFDGGTVTINAQNVILDNSSGGAPPPIDAVPSSGALAVNADTIQLGGGSGMNALNVDGYANLNFNASGGILIAATKSVSKDSSGNAIPGATTLTTAGAWQITAPVITGVTGANETLNASGALTINPAAGGSAGTVVGGLGATLTLVGASVAENSLIQLPSGTLEIEATGAHGNVTVGGTLDVSGTAQPFNDLIKYTSGGQITLTSDTGSVNLNPGGNVKVAANSGGGNAGSLTVSAKKGLFTFASNTINGQGGTGGQGGAFSLDVGSLPDLDSLDPALSAGGFTQAQTIRVRTGDVTINDTIKTNAFSLSADAGSILVNGTIDASNVGATGSAGNSIQIGGAISLVASGSVTLGTGADLTVAGQNFNNAGKGGTVSLEAGSEINGTSNPNGFVNIQAGSIINLSVAANTGASAAAGDFTGTLHIRAPQTAGNTDLQVDPINGTIVNASSIVAEGYQVYAPAGGSIDSVEGDVLSNGTTFAGNASTIATRLLANNGGIASVFNVEVGAEIINPTGDLTLNNDWDLSQYRFGPNGVPGDLTLRAEGNLVFNGSLSDGFDSSAYNATLLTQNAALPANLQSWSYRLVAGADFSAADFHQVLPTTAIYDPSTGLAIPGTAGGSLELGQFVITNGGNALSTSGTKATTSQVLQGFYQVIRTGTGDIDVSTSGDVLLQNQFATIYTAGVQAVALPADTFDVPQPVSITLSAEGSLGASQESPTYAAQYTLAGGNVTIAAQGNIAHVTENNGTLVEDSQKELPNNWLYRRGYVVASGADAGQFGISGDGTNTVASTSWWTDFSNFFEGIGALGGGNVTLTAGHDVSNVDAVAPTNARVTKQTTLPDGTVDALAADQTLVELGGGNVVVQAGHDINGGVYYVERGQGTLSAGGSITTNSTRSASLGTITSPASIDSSATWLPTTLFLGKGGFDVTAQDNLLLGPVANPFLLPQGMSNTYWDKTYFSTYATTDTISATSLTGAVTLRESATPLSASVPEPLLINWLQNIDLLTSNPDSLSFYQPWLRLDETSVQPFQTVVALLPSTLQATAFSGDINVDGNLTLSPSSMGTIDLTAAGSINGLQPTGNPTVTLENAWSYSTVNLSDANPGAIPGVNSPYAYQVVAGTNRLAASQTQGITIKGVFIALNLSFIDDLFDESGSTTGNHGVLQTEQTLHANINDAPLHAHDPNPVHLYAKMGDISGLTLFSGKAAQIVAGQDITDVAFYVQNDNANDISLIAAGRDIIAYDTNSPLRVAAQKSGNVLDVSNAGAIPLAGDLQISGPGTLEVLAGRNLDLGVGPNNSDGTGVGISSIGNARNPVLPFAGADIFAAAGLGTSSGFDASQMNFGTFSLVNGVPVVDDPLSFIGELLSPITSGNEGARYLPDLGQLLGVIGATDAQVWNIFSGAPDSSLTSKEKTIQAQLTPEKRDDLALDVFYLVLRDAGRDHNDPSSPGAGSYAAGYAAIKALFSGTTLNAPWPGQGDISLTSREIKTTNGGNINLLAPGGQLDVGLNVAGTQPVDQGILTEDGGNISIFTNGNVDVGTSRIFTLNGGNEIIWSTTGNIAAGASSKTVQSAPPTRVLIDPQSGAVQTDLAGLATGGGIGVLETVSGALPSDVDLIVPNGTVDAGDAGIRASGNLSIAAVQVLNAGNIQVGGKSTGLPTVTAPNVAGLSAASSAAGAGSNAANEVARQQQQNSAGQQISSLPSIITVEVLGYGGTSDEND